MSLFSVLTAFARRTQTQIRDTALALLKAGYSVAGKDIDIQEGSDAWMFYSVMALFLEGIQQQAAVNVAQAFPDTATDDNVDHHARVQGLTRKVSTEGVVEVTIVGTPGATWTDGLLGTSPDGILWAILSGYGGTIPGGGSTTTRWVSQSTAGTQANKAAGTIITFQSPPAGINAQTTVTQQITYGTDTETNAQLAARTLARIREKPSGFNRGEVRALFEAQPTVAEAYVYPAYQPADDGHAITGAGTLASPGYVTALVLGAPPNRLMSNADIDALAPIISAARPTVLLLAGLVARRPRTINQAITIQVTLTDAYSFPFAATYSVNGTGSSTSLVKVSADPALVKVGDLFAVETDAPRGNYEVRRATAVDHTNHTITPDAAFTATPVAASTIFPAPANWLAMTAAVLAVFDRLGPGDTANANSKRYPPQSERGPSILFVSQLTAALVRTLGPFGEEVGVDGVAAVSVTTPGTDIAAAEAQLVVPTSIVFTA